jgi:hypothetical protein
MNAEFCGRSGPSRPPELRSIIEVKAKRRAKHNLSEEVVEQVAE